MAKRNRKNSKVAQSGKHETEHDSVQGPPVQPSNLVESLSSSKAERPQRTWRDVGASIRDRIVFGFFRLLILSPLIMLASPIVYIPFYRVSLKDVAFTVERRERVTKGAGDSQQSYYLVWSKEGEVYCVADSWSFMSFDSSDRYGKLREGSSVEARVAGWRVPFLSWYRNVVEIKSVTP